MPNFKFRSIEEELLDQPNIPKIALFQNLKELDTINRLLGGHLATLKGLEQLMVDKTKTYSIVDFACGGGDTLKAIDSWAKKKGYKVKLIGFDLLEDAITFAKKETKGVNIEWLVGDFNTIQLPEADIAICSLVCHHFYEDQLAIFLTKMHATAKLGVLINDLHRHPFAYYGISILTHFFSKSHLVKNDAKLSVLKGFSKAEWNSFLEKLEFKKFSISWIWAFRHLILIRK